jgi:hypothetical protein
MSMDRRELKKAADELLQQSQEHDRKPPRQKRPYRSPRRNQIRQHWNHVVQDRQRADWERYEAEQAAIRAEPKEPS